MTNKLEQIYHKKLKLLNETIWDKKATYKKIIGWLDNFEADEKIHALFLLTQFTYFNEFQIEKMLICIYRDFFKYSQIEKIRISNKNTRDLAFINQEYQKVLDKTRFVALGNPSESSAYLMYIFRKENGLAKSYFISDNQILTHSGEIENFVFIDDICGSGSQAVQYASDILPLIKYKYPNAKTYYYMLLATKEGKEIIKKESNFDYVDSIMDLDETFKCFNHNSRIFKNIDPAIDINKIKEFCERNGKKLMLTLAEITLTTKTKDYQIEWAEYNKLGFGDMQLLIGFNHNTPDNTLPVFWYDEGTPTWTPIFKRKNKKY